jgi:DNA repair exonuclease SbcCD ATPase subunit
MDETPSISDGEEPEELSAADAEFFRCLFGPVDEPAQTGDPRVELDQAQSRIEELEVETNQVQALQERVHTLEAEAKASVALHQRIRELEQQLKKADHTQEAMRQRNLEWQTKFQAEQSARQHAELRAGECQAQIGHWQEESQLLKSQLDASVQVIAGLRAEIQQLEPLKVWGGHPCSVCHKPMSGSVARNLAAEKMKDLAHRGCLRRQGPGVGEAILAGGALWGLSQLSKR